MRVPRLHLDQPLAEGARLRLSEAGARHVRTVLRLRVGADLVVFDGHGNAHLASLVRLSRDEVLVEVGEAQPGNVESPLRVTLALGVSRGERMDLAVQKAVELGVAAIQPLLTRRSVVRLDGDRALRRQAHWQTIASNACEQCGRNRVPPVSTAIVLDAWLASDSAHGLRLLPDPRAATGLRRIDADVAGGVTLLIGPEGGLAEAEHALARSQGFVGVRMGPRVLRTETAVIAALASVMTLWGDLGD